jgi:hypothetical protein
LAPASAPSQFTISVTLASSGNPAVTNQGNYIQYVSVVTNQVAAPTFSAPSGTAVPVTVTISTITSGAMIRYTVDGTDPNTNSTLYANPLYLASATTLKARAFKSGLLDSDVASASYTSLNPYHSADYRSPFWVIDGTEVNRILSYWRAGAFHIDPLGLDGFAPDVGNTNGPRHSADYRAPYWVLDGTEANRVLSYWRAGGYHRDSTGADGYAPGLSGGAMILSDSKLNVTDAPSINQDAPATYSAGGLATVTNAFVFANMPLSLLLRPRLPAGWKINSASGDGNPEVNSGEILWTGSIPSSPIKMFYTVDIPSGDSGTKEIHAEVEYQLAGQSNPATTLASPDPLLLGGSGSGFCQITRLVPLAQGQIQMSLRAETGRTYEIQTSGDLATWKTLTVVTNLTGNLQINDSESATAQTRFYRTRLAP